jgi:hypothetical protein
MFKKPESASHVNITNIQGVTIVGDGNIVNAQFTELAGAQDELDQAVSRSDNLSDEQKLDAAGVSSNARRICAMSCRTPTTWRGLCRPGP